MSSQCPGDGCARTVTRRCLWSSRRPSRATREHFDDRTCVAGGSTLSRAGTIRGVREVRSRRLGHPRCCARSHAGADQIHAHQARRGPSQRRGPRRARSGPPPRDETSVQAVGSTTTQGRRGAASRVCLGGRRSADARSASSEPDGPHHTREAAARRPSHSKNGRRRIGRGEGIRTPGTLARSTDFKSVAFDHSATPPRAPVLEDRGRFVERSRVSPDAGRARRKRRRRDRARRTRGARSASRERARTHRTSRPPRPRR